MAEALSARETANLELEESRAKLLRLRAELAAPPVAVPAAASDGLQVSAPVQDLPAALAQLVELQAQLQRTTAERDAALEKALVPADPPDAAMEEEELADLEVQLATAAAAFAATHEQKPEALDPARVRALASLTEKVHAARRPGLVRRTVDKR